MTTTGIGIITYRGHHRVLNLLESIRRRDLGVDHRAVHIAVYDDGSPEGIPEQTKDALRGLRSESLFADAYVFGDPQNHGIAYAWNRVTEALFHKNNVDQVILLNDDVLMVDGWLEKWVYFVENNPHAGQVGFGFYWFDPIDVRALLDNPDAVQPRTHDMRDLDASGQRRHVPRNDVGDAQPGRVVAAPGCAFGFSRTAWDETDGFPEDFISFHEESHHGFCLTAKNRPGYVLTHPMIWHQWAATFRDCPELKPSETMRHSRQKFCERWNVPSEFAGRPFDYTHPLVMSKVPAYPIKWISPSGLKNAIDPICQCVHCQKARG